MTLRRSLSIALGAIALSAAASAPAVALKPFSADYTASYMGMQGAGKMTITPAGGNRWKYSLSIRNNVAQLSQVTTFEDKGGQLRPLSSSDSSLLLIKKVNRNATYDWSKGEARWTGDVKPERAGPVKLQAGDLDALLVNLALARDAAAGKAGSYRMVDDGRVKQISYTIDGKETLQIGGRDREATRATYRDGDKQYVVWAVEGIPVPARILQRKDGQDQIDLRIASLK